MNINTKRYTHSLTDGCVICAEKNVLRSIVVLVDPEAQDISPRGHLSPYTSESLPICENPDHEKKVRQDLEELKINNSDISVYTYPKKR